ncbi:DUF1294 domain-containing protein [Pseudoxanthomonas sp. 22568]
MRFAGRITDWNGERGFGFVVPHGGGERAFVHVSEFQRGSRPPMVGDLISYETRKDAKGRLNAKAIRFAGQKIEAPGKHQRIPRLGTALAFFLLLAIFTLFGKVPGTVSLAYLAASLVSYVLYCLDKAAAERAYRRIPESTLHLVDFLFGWPGGLIAQQQCRHKIAKDSFQRVFWLTVFLNLAGAYGLVASGIAQRLSSAFPGV